MFNFKTSKDCVVKILSFLVNGVKRAVHTATRAATHRGTPAPTETTPESCNYLCAHLFTTNTLRFTSIYRIGSSASEQDTIDDEVSSSNSLMVIK